MLSYTMLELIGSSYGMQTRPLVRLPFANGTYAQPKYTMDEVDAVNVGDGVAEAVIVTVDDADREAVAVKLEVSE